MLKLNKTEIKRVHLGTPFSKHIRAKIKKKIPKEVWRGIIYSRTKIRSTVPLISPLKQYKQEENGVKQLKVLRKNPISLKFCTLI